MKILIVTTGFPDKQNSDIAGKFVLNEAIAYAINGAIVTVLTPHQPGAKKRELIMNNLTVYRFRYFYPIKYQALKTPNKPIYAQKSFLSLIQIPLLLLSFLVQIMKRGRDVDIIHCQWTITALLALPCKWLYRKKVVMTVRGSDVRLIPKWLNKYIHKKMDAVIDCYGEQIWNIKNRENFPANYYKLPLIVDIDTKKKYAIPASMAEKIGNIHDHFIIIYLGRFDQVKINDGLPILQLIKAVSILKDYNIENFHLFYIGDGDVNLKRNMQIAVDRLDLNKFITFLGPKQKVQQYIPFCNLGIGGIAFNAVSQEFSVFEKPQLMFYNFYNERTPWQHQRNVLFADPNEANDIAEKIRFAIQNPDKMKEIGENAGHLISKYVENCKTGGEKYINFFQTLKEKDKNAQK